jgi:selenocysteine-specific elongation factor
MTLIATAGHVDHGKTSLVEALTGTNTDRLEEEKRRGLTIDLGFAHSTGSAGEVLSFIDVPGHIRFLRNMLAGVGGIDMCLLVVDAREGWMPQTQEHFDILRLLGVQHGVVALTKCDLLSEAEREDARLLVEMQLEDTFLSDATIVETSIHDESSIELLRQKILSIVHAPRQIKSRPRIWIDRVFSLTGVGTVVTGTLLDASLTVGADITILPAGHKGRIRQLHSHNQEVETSEPGSRVAVNVHGISHNDINRGDLLVLPEQWMLSNTLDVELHALPYLAHSITRRGHFLMYIGSDEVEVSLRLIQAESIAPGTSAKARLYLQHPIAVAPQDKFILRETGRDETVAGGIVLDIDPVLRLTKADPQYDVQHLLDERGMMNTNELFLRTGVQAIPTVDDVIFSSAMLTAAKAEVFHMLNSQRSLASELQGIDLVGLPDHLAQAARTFRPEEAVIENGRLYLPELAPSQKQTHPLVQEFIDALFTPPDPNAFDRALLRRLVQEGHLLNLDGVFFASRTLDRAHAVVKDLLTQHPDGITTSAFREAANTTRKYAVPLLEALDARGITRRRGDLRIAGPRL